MSGTRKHGAHRVHLTTGNIAAANALPAAIWTYDAYAGPQSVVTASGGVDSTLERVVEMNLALSAALTGQATNFTTFIVSHFSAAGGTAKNIFTLACSTAQFIFAANVPWNLAVANGAVPNGNTGTGTLAITGSVGIALPWPLVNGDQIQLAATQTGTGQFVGGAGVTFLIAAGA
jgi:hypothetical protein